ncbi:hypothetical protein [Pseudoalteromonas sp. D48-MNA-CIBAN-0056]|uniref:hypothetical protein n=1 Tax=Pseudoalteromonas sp. D48-MNA-CIBAN-0056 TaxID=3140417 RepID=UPI003328B804
MLVERKTQLMSIEEFNEVEVMDFTAVRLKHPLKPETGRPIDLGSLAFSKRQKTNEINSTSGNRATLVDLNSLRPERSFFISNFSGNLGKSATTQKTNLKEIMPICDWMDSNGYENYLEGKQQLHDAYLAYTTHLNNRLKSNDDAIKITSRVAKDKQWMCRKLIDIAFPGELDAIIGGIKTIKAAKTPKAIIKSSYVDHYWELNLELFNKFSAQFISNDDFPPHIKTPTINSYYMPCHSRQLPILIPDIQSINKYTANKAPITYFDYFNGKPVRATDDHTNREKDKINEFTQIFSEIKANKLSQDRINLAMRAQYAFIQCFRILTRINNAELIKLVYLEEYEKKRDVLAQGFYEVKLRANDRHVKFRIQTKGYQLFKKYLELRKLLLDGKECPYLFFSLGEKNIGMPQQLNRQHTDKHHSYLRKMGFLQEELKALKDQELRNLNTRFLRKLGFSAKEVADNNNHNVEVADEIYADTPPEEQVEELGNFFQAMREAAKKTTHMSKSNTKPTTAGSCDDKNEIPIAIIDDAPFEPDCKTPQGCLFCRYYVCHADEEDLKKLMSLKFVIELIREKAIDFEFADEMYSLIDIRIDFILEHIASRSASNAELVQKMKKDVLSDGDLTTFWEDRLDYYEEMGLVVS